jgi:hypothetical protein
MPPYIIIHGIHTSNKSPVEYVSDIVYGNPKVEAVLVGSRFVAICEYSEIQTRTAKHTFDRMGSFNLGAQLMFDLDIALREFGIWVRHYAPGAIVGNPVTV